MKQLKEAYEARDTLWRELRESFDLACKEKFVTRIYSLTDAACSHIAENAISSLSTINADIDDTVSAIEKKSKEVARSFGKDSKAKLLRDLLAEM